MNSKIKPRHLHNPAYIYVRQSTLAQVRHHQESTERQYALCDQASELGWPAERIRVLDGDLGRSGAQSHARVDFKTLVADVAMGQVGAVFALEASRLARSNADWHHLIELCAVTGTVLIDEDGCYDPADFNDRLLLGMKGTMSNAELHFLYGRLQGGKLNKAKKGELRHPLAVGLCYDDESQIVFDPDEEVQGAVRLVFELFRRTGSAYQVVHHFVRQGLLFPKRAYGGVWNGKIIWGRLTHGRVLGILKNPFLAGAYVHGRYQAIKVITPDGQIRSRVQEMPMSAWKVKILEHHEGYITWKEYLTNRKKLEENRTNGVDTLLSGPAREGHALLQGLLVCSSCSHRLSVRYKGNGGIYPLYECNKLKRDGLSHKSCLNVRSDLLDTLVVRRILEVLEPAQLQIAVEALHELERRDEVVGKQWRMRIERAEYEAQLAQRRYEEVDPSNRLVAANLERRWNDALVKVEELRKQYPEFQATQGRAITSEQKAKIMALAQDFPRLWQAPNTQDKDKKRMLRLLIKDITVEKTQPKQLVLHLRWQGGACEDIFVEIPQAIYDRLRYDKELVERIRELARGLPDDQIAVLLNEEGRRSAKGKIFTTSMIKWIRYRYRIPSPQLKRPEELSVQQVSQRFGVSHHVVYYWIQRGVIKARRLNRGSPYWITIDAHKEEELLKSVRNSSRIGSRQGDFRKLTVGGAI